MKENKEFISNENYFKKGDTLKYVAIGMAGASGAICFSGMGFISFILMAMGLTAAAVLFIISTIGRSSETDIDAFVEKHTEGVEFKTEFPKDLEKRLLKTPAVYVAKGYDLSDGSMYKKGKTGLVRSPKYSKAILYPFRDALGVCYRKVSLVSDECENVQTEIPYASISSIEIKTEEKRLAIGKDTVRAKETRLILKKEDGSIISLVTEDSVLTDDFVKKINEKISASKI